MDGSRDQKSSNFSGSYGRKNSLIGVALASFDVMVAKFQLSSTVLKSEKWSYTTIDLCPLIVVGIAGFDAQTV